MKIPSLVLTAGALLCAAPLLAQRRDGLISLDDMRKVRPNSCPIADSLAGRSLERSSQVAWGWREGTTNNLISSGLYTLTGKKPIDGIILTAISRGEGPHPDATYALQLRLRDTVLREGAAATLVLIMDDSLTVEIGDMLGEPTPFAHDRTVDQMLTQMLPRGIVIRLVTATKVTGRIGPTPFELPRRTLETFRSVFIAAACGQRL